MAHPPFLRYAFLWQKLQRRRYSSSSSSSGTSIMSCSSSLPLQPSQGFLEPHPQPPPPSPAPPEPPAAAEAMALQAQDKTGLEVPKGCLRIKCKHRHQCISTTMNPYALLLRDMLCKLYHCQSTCSAYLPLQRGQLYPYQRGQLYPYQRGQIYPYQRDVNYLAASLRQATNLIKHSASSTMHAKSCTQAFPLIGDAFLTKAGSNNSAHRKCFCR